MMPPKDGSMLKRAPSRVSVCLTQSLLASLLSLTLVLAPPAFADDESATTCGVDVVFLIDTGGSAVGGFGRIEEAHRLRKLPGYAWMTHENAGHSLAVATRGNAKAIIDALSGEGADIRFAIADYTGDPAQHHEAGHYGELIGRPKLLDDPKKTSTDSLEQRLFVANTETFQVQRFRNPRGLSRTDHSRRVSSGPNSPDNTTPESFGRGRSWGGTGEASESEPSKAGGWFGENEFGRAGPNGIAIDSQRNFYALDAGGSRVQKFSSFGLFITQWGGKGSGPGEFYYGKDHGGPMGIAIAGNRVFVTDQGNFRVQVFTQDGKYVSAFGTNGTGNGQFLKPTHVTVDSKGHVYVTDWERRDVQKFVSSASGYEWALTFGGKETVAHEQGLFYAKADGYGPNGIAVNSKDLIHVSDSGNCRVQVFDSGGVFQHQIPAAHYTPAKVLAKRKRDKEYLISKVVKKAKSYKEGTVERVVKNATTGSLGARRYYIKYWLSKYKEMGGTLTGDAIFTDAAIKEVMTILVNDRKWYADNYWQRDFDKHKDWLPNAVMAELYGAARPAGGGGVGKPTAPVDVCNTLRANEVDYKQYETHVNFSGPIPGRLPKWTKSAQPEYPASKWVGPGAIAIGNNDEIFVVDAPYADSALSTTMSIKQFSASGEYMGLVLKSGRSIPSLSGIAMWRNRGTAPSKMALDPLRKLEYARSAYRVAKQFMPPERRHGLRDEDIATTALETTVRQHQFRSGDDNGGLFALHQLATDGIPAPGKGYFSCWASATPPGTSEERAKACPSAIGWRESKDIARVIVWYGSQASHTVSVNVDQAIAALKENDITVAVVNLFIGQKINTNWTLEKNFGHWYGPGMNNDYFSKRGVGIDCPDPTLTRASSKLVKTCPFGGVVDGDGQATRIIDATGGVYQHLFEGDHQGNAESVRKYWNDGKGVYGPTLKFIMDQFSPPPMAGSSVPVTVSNDGKTLYVAKFDDGKATGDIEAWSLNAASIPT
ncbi:MAG TPA: 6-bladed beta-propeller, partial [Gammaproteobacteria bacterium]|nr:6-bladed beta-propeller [Gammaproteobacteria bacterium]